MICEYQLTVRGLRIHAQSAGEGVPLLLHSGVWNEMHQWGSLIRHLHGFRVITYDAPGVGSSQVPSSAYWLTCGPGDALAVRDRACPWWLLRAGT